MGKQKKTGVKLAVKNSKNKNPPKKRTHKTKPVKTNLKRLNLKTRDETAKVNLQFASLEIRNLRNLGSGKQDARKKASITKKFSKSHKQDINELTQAISNL